MTESQITKLLEDNHIELNTKTNYYINGWKISLQNNIVKYFSNTCTEGYELEDINQIEDLIKCNGNIEDRCICACVLKNHTFTEATAMKAMEFLNNRAFYDSILRRFDPMRIVNRIEWKIEPDTERHFIYIHINLEVPIFYELTMNRMMDEYFQELKTECREIGLGPNDFKPLPYNWS